MKTLLFANTDWYLYNFRRSLVMALRDAGHDVLLVSPPGPYGERLQALGFRWIAAPMERRSLNPIREARLINWLRRLMIAERVDLVHSFTIKCAVYGSLAARIAGVPARVNAVAGMGYVFSSDDLKARVLRPVVRTLMKAALDGEGARLILQNPDDAEIFRQAELVYPDRVRLIPGSGVDCERFSPKAPGLRDMQIDVLKVVLPARLLWDKGVAEFVEAARMLRAQGSKMHFVLAGSPDSGNPAAVPEEKLQEWVNEGLIEWLGHVDDMPALFQNVDVVALPSYREGLPKGLIEAAACALPIVTTDVPGCREVVTNECDGLLVPAKDARALAVALARLESDSVMREQLGQAARKTAVEKFDERIVIANTISVYDELNSEVTA